jgi:glycosyltransferase involved in cell wall biosynthesis
MRIAIDASTISTQGGPRTYVLGLVEALLRLDHDNEYVIFYNDPVHLGRFPSAREIVLPGKSPLARLWREHVVLPLACRREGINVLHCPKSAIPYFSPCPTVVTLHDLIPYNQPHFEKFAARLYWRLQIPIAARRSDYIITISEHARREISTQFAVPDSKISVIFNGFDRQMLKPRTNEDGTRIRSRYSLPEQYILYVGTIQPRKNIISLIEAYARLSREEESVGKLVIVGRKGWLYDDLFARITALGVSDRVIFTGFVPDEDLPYIYDGAALFVYLSLSEGFGIPPLEAMACGVPVIVSNMTAVPEVVGDAGITLEPTDIEQVVAAMKKVLFNASLAADMQSRGIARAAQFSWDAAACQVLAVYRRVNADCKKECAV